MIHHFNQVQLLMKNILGCTGYLYNFSKRIIAMRGAKVQIDDNKNTKMLNANPNRVPENPTSFIDWEAMQFDKLCALSPKVLSQIQVEIKKKKMNVRDQFFESNKQIVNPQQELSPYWLSIFQIFCNMKGYEKDKIERVRKQGYLVKMFVDDIESDEQLLKIVDKFVSNIHDIKRLEGIAEPTFCKYLLSLKRDLQMQGLRVDSLVKTNKKDIKILSVLNNEYEFWVDLKHNRAKNGEAENFIINKKTIENPNKTLFITEQYPQVDVTYISRIKKRKNIEMKFVHKMLLEIQVDGFIHMIKIERNGPSNSKVETQLRNGYLVIDYDNIYKGNPTVSPIFQF